MIIFVFLLSIVPSVQETVVSEEIMHNLDTCEVTVVGDELDGEHEGLEVDVTHLQQRGLEMSSSNLGLVITGTGFWYLDCSHVTPLMMLFHSPFHVTPSVSQVSTPWPTTSRSCTSSATRTGTLRRCLTGNSNWSALSLMAATSATSSRWR